MIQHPASTGDPGDNATETIRHLPGLNALRALAALCVIPGHIEQMKSLVGLPYHYWFPIPGKLGVILFFALSGFLITTLLLNEKNRTQHISLKKFYVRRMLRIWPLYFLLMMLSLFLLNKIDLFKVQPFSNMLYHNFHFNDVLLVLLILPNYLKLVIPYAAQSWSIGIEEQFYMFQPLVIKTINRIRFLLLFLFIIVFGQEISTYANTFAHSRILAVIVPQLHFFGCIALGCFGAICYHARPSIAIKIFHSRTVQALAVVSLTAFVIAINMTNNENIVDFRLHALAFTIIIANAAYNDKSLYRITNHVLDYLGRISYGIYMYHVIGIGAAIAMVKLFPGAYSNRIILDVFIYLTTFTVTIVLSTVSFNYFENYFLNLKTKITSSASIKSFCNSAHP